MSEVKEKPFRLHIGAAYYPEHWPEERWEVDIKLMKDANLSVARLGEFAWCTLEPAEGAYSLDWLNRAITLLEENGIAVILGTPTAAPPAWLTQKYPETLAIEETGRPAQHGNRCHYCVNSQPYHAATRKIVQEMAERFGNNPNVIGWQIDNEFSRVCYCDHCRLLFQSFLSDRYETLDVLNQRWSTAYWSQAYNSWDQIPLPIGPHNPGLRLEFKRFITYSYRNYQKIQIDELRPRIPGDVWIAHNFMGWFDGFDHYELSEDLDLASWDDYVGHGHHDYLNHSAVHSLTRGFKNKNYWVMETQPGSVNWSPVNNMLNKGEARAMAWQGVAHGTDGLLYWQWRSALGGQEQYHGTLVDQSGSPRLFYDEVKQLGEEFLKISDLLENSIPKARVAILFDYESRWVIEWQKHHQDFNFVAHLLHYYRAFVRRNLAVDILPAKKLTDWNQLKGYKVVIVPAINIMTEMLAKVLEDYVKHGNHLVLTLRTGWKDEYNALLPMRPPGYLSKIAGVEVEEFFALDEPVAIKGNFFEGEASIWAERLKLTGQYALAMGKYKESNGWLDGKPAASVTGVHGGSGLVYYVGAYLDEDAQQVMVDRLITNSHLRAITTPENVEVHTRTREDGTEVYFVINHSRQEATMWLPWIAREHLEDRLIEDELQLGPYGVAIVTKEEEEE